MKTSLIFKWLKSINTSSQESRDIANKTRKLLGLTPKEYRKLLSLGRQKINVLEQKLCANQWGKIDYEGVPSRAATIYRNAFKKHDGDRYQKFLDAVEVGTKEIKATTLYPYDLVHEAWHKSGDRTIDLQWKALPNYLKDNPHNGIVIADVSGSMSGRPMEVCISLAIYFAERNVGAFKDKFMTFSASPQLQSVKGSTLWEKINNLSRADWGMNTNLQAAFDKILNTAVENRVPAKDMPTVLYIISDMEFDACVKGASNFATMQKKYEAAGYRLPIVVFWNVDARNNQVPVERDQRGVYLVSGCSPSILKSALNQKLVTPYEAMLEVVNSERYLPILVSPAKTPKTLANKISVKKLPRKNKSGEILARARTKLGVKNKKHKV